MARYRTGRRDFLLHVSIVALAATATSLNVARANRLEPLQALARHLSPHPIALRFPRLPRITRPSHAARTAPEVLTPPVYAEPPSVTVVSPDIETPIISAPPAPPPPASPPPTADAAGGDEASAATETPEPPAPAVPARAVTVAYLRTAPSTAAVISGSLPPGTPVTIVACSAACSWYLIQPPSGAQVWSAASWYSVAGNLGTLPVR